MVAKGAVWRQPNMSNAPMISAVGEQYCGIISKNLEKPYFQAISGHKVHIISDKKNVSHSNDTGMTHIDEKNDDRDGARIPVVKGLMPLVAFYCQKQAARTTKK